MLLNHAFSRSVSTFSASQLLSENHKQTFLSRLVDLPTLRSPGKTAYKNKSASVLVPLCVDKNDKVCLLFTKRSRKLKKHSGEVSFPGGVADLNDSDEVATALRETEEELGINPGNVEVWGAMKPVGDARGKHSVTPIIGHVTLNPIDPTTLVHSPDEVDLIFTKTLEELASPQSCKYTQFRVPGRMGYTLPVYDVEPHRIWGMTAIITYQFLTIFLEKKDFRHKLQFSSPIKSS